MVQERDKGILRKEEEITVTFDPKARCVYFKSRTFNCFSDDIMLNDD